MVKPGYTDSGDSLTDRAKAYHAEGIITDLAQGKPVASEVITQAKESCIDLLSSDQVAMKGIAQNGLVALYFDCLYGLIRSNLLYISHLCD